MSDDDNNTQQPTLFQWRAWSITRVDNDVYVWTGFQREGDHDFNVVEFVPGSNGWVRTVRGSRSEVNWSAGNADAQDMSAHPWREENGPPVQLTDVMLAETLKILVSGSTRVLQTSPDGFIIQQDDGLKFAFGADGNVRMARSSQPLALGSLPAPASPVSPAPAPARPRPTPAAPRGKQWRWMDWIFMAAESGEVYVWTADYSEGNASFRAVEFVRGSNGWVRGVTVSKSEIHWSSGSIDLQALSAYPWRGDGRTPTRVPDGDLRDTLQALMSQNINLVDVSPRGFIIQQHDGVMCLFTRECTVQFGLAGNRDSLKAALQDRGAQGAAAMPSRAPAATAPAAAAAAGSSPVSTDATRIAALEAENARLRARIAQLEAEAASLREAAAAAVPGNPTCDEELRVGPRGLPMNPAI